MPLRCFPDILTGKLPRQIPYDKQSSWDLTDFDERRAALSRWIKKQVIKVEVSALIAGP